MTLLAGTATAQPAFAMSPLDALKISRAAATVGCQAEGEPKLMSSSNDILKSQEVYIVNCFLSDAYVIVVCEGNNCRVAR